MISTLERLEGRVAAAVALISSLRQKASVLESELESSRAARAASPQAETADPRVLEELERLRSERILARGIVREMLREIDRVAW